MVERHKFTIFYTAPTAIRALAAQGDEFVAKYDRSSLRVLGTVGEPINPEAWEWYWHTVGEGRCTIVDTWWQTETGGICISPVAPATPVVGGSATLPLPGIQPRLFSAEGEMLEGEAEGLLCIEHPWPGQTRTIWGDHPRYVETYFSTIDGYYFTGDGCRRDEHGYYWITGRVDDVINVSGHRMGTAEFEAVLVEHDGCRGRRELEVLEAFLHVDEHVGEGTVVIDHDFLNHRRGRVLGRAHGLLAHVDDGHGGRRALEDDGARNVACCGRVDRAFHGHIPSGVTTTTPVSTSTTGCEQDHQYRSDDSAQFKSI